MTDLNLRKSSLLSLIFGLLTIIATGCGENFDVTYRPKGECWDIGDEVALSSSISTATVRPELMFDFDQDYLFTNLQFKMVCTSPSGDEDVYEFQTTVLSATGDWLIEPSSGGYQVIIALADEFVTEEPGEYTFSLTHNMREDQICGIRVVSMRLPK